MKVTVAKSAGFCFGVKRAVETVYKEAEKAKEEGRPIYTFGPIIHNEAVVSDLEKKGVKAVASIEELKEQPRGTVIIRSHGVGRNVYEEIKDSGFEIVDATCPFVLKIHRFAERYGREGYYLVIIGNREHPEVEGIMGWAVRGAAAVIENREEAENFTLEQSKKVCIVSQTTFNYNKFQELVEIIREKGYDINVLNTICNATSERQAEAAGISKEVDAMIVIGGKTSSNTQKLFEICKKECENTYYIQTFKDLDLSRLKSVDNVGITAGASTPNNIIEEVQKNVRIKF